MALSMAEIRAKKPVAIMSDEHKALRGDVENDKPYWADSHTAEEWRGRNWFERKGSEADTYCAYVSDLSELEV